MAKNRIVAVVLNFFVLGLGYLYLGKKRVFGGLMVVGSILVYVAFLLSYQLEIGIPVAYQLTNAFGQLVIGIAFAIDAYQISGESGSTTT